MNSNDQDISILIVDDRPENLLAMGKTLEKPGLRILTATTGNEALKHLLREEFALALLDVQMPMMDGFEVAELMRSRKLTRHIPIIFVTAFQRDEAQVFKGYDTGAVDYLFKPIDPITLKSKVDIFVELFKHKKVIEERNKQLSAKIRELTELKLELENRTDELKEVNAELNNFAYTVSHDLRTPLRQMTAFLDLIQEEIETDPPQCTKYIESSLTIAARMNELIDDLLWLSRVDSMKLEREDVNISAISKNILSTLEINLESKPFTYEVEDSIAINGDIRLLQIVMENILGNAVKFSTKTEDPRIQVSSSVNDNGNTVVSIEDNGVGFDDQKAEEIFKPFIRLHNSKEFYGTGIGLATVKKIIDRHEGKIWVESDPGKGTTFFFSLK